MAGFVGRERELASLERMLQRVAEGGRGDRPGRAVLMRGRRRVGKSRLVEEFVERAGVPYLFFTASAQPTVEADLALFTEAALASELSDAFAAQSPRRSDERRVGQEGAARG